MRPISIPTSRRARNVTVAPRAWTRRSPPICVAACPVRALEFGPIAELRETHGDLAAIAPLPDASYTSPNICIRPSPAARPPMSPDGFVSNEAEIDQ